MIIETTDRTASATSGTVDRALELLELLREAGEPLGVRDLARRLSLSPATVHRLLASLRNHGFVVQAVDSRAYGIGWGFLDFASSLLANVGLAEVAGPVARELRDLTRETVTVQIPVGRDRVCVHEAEGLHEVRRRVGLGRTVPLHAGASGRAILAFLPDEEIGAILAAPNPARLTDLTETDPDRLRRLLEETRRTGVASSGGESVAGVSSVATPVFDGSGSVAGSIAISGPNERWTSAAMTTYRDELLAAGFELSRRLGFRGTHPFWPALQTSAAQTSAAQTSAAQTTAGSGR